MYRKPWLCGHGPERVIPLVRKRKPTGRKKKLTSKVLTESERRRTMREKAGMVNTNNKEPSKKQKKETCLSSSSEEIPLDTSDDSFDKDSNDDFCVVYKEYFYAKKMSRVTGFSTSNATNGCTKIAMMIICTE
ncbi:hypothetical protein TNCV_3796211 [Trichonephila clavipes]|nr:hypothetical protein TNCV_3796211 [Trichonephila clavipes]